MSGFFGLNFEQEKKRLFTIKSVKSTVSSGHPLLSGQLSVPKITSHNYCAIWTSVRWSPLLSSRGHPVLSPVLTSFSWSFCIEVNDYTRVTNSLQVIEF